MFINISFHRDDIKNITFDSLLFTDIRFYENSENMFTDVRMKPNCTINMATSITEDEEYFSRYSPYNIIQQLKE